MIEQRLGEESGAPSAIVLPLPADGGDGGEGDPLAKLKSDIAKAKGRPVVVKTTSGGFGEGPGSAPQRDWQQSRIGADPPEALIDLRRESILSVMSACQVPISLITDADGTSQRDAWRRFVMGAVEPLSRRMAEEFGRKLELPSINFRFRSQSYPSESQLQLACDLDLGTLKRLETARGGKDLTLWIQLWPRIEHRPPIPAAAQRWREAKPVRAPDHRPEAPDADSIFERGHRTDP